MDCSPCRRTRRSALRMLGLAALALPAALRPHAADAIHGWCQNDPIVQIDGQTADIYLSSYLEMLELATGPTQIVVTVPPGIPTRLVATDPGFAHFGYDVRFEESNKLTNNERVVEVQIKVYAPALDAPEGPLPLKVDFTPRGNGRLVPGSAEGRANKWVTLRTQ
jgi:hypothetical protein